MPEQTTAQSEKQKPARKLTPAAALLRSHTIKKLLLAKQKENKKGSHVTFDDDGQSITQSTADESSTSLKKRKASSKDSESGKKKSKASRKKAKKGKGKPSTASDTPKKDQDEKQTEALTYLRQFHRDRDHWKFSKKQQIWVLQHLYDLEAIPEQDSDALIVYLKGLQGQAREKTLSEAQAMQQQPASGSSLSNYCAPADDNDDDDFDAEKLLAKAYSQKPAHDPKSTRAKAIVTALS